MKPISPVHSSRSLPFQRKSATESPTFLCFPFLLFIRFYFSYNSLAVYPFTSFCQCIWQSYRPSIYFHPSVHSSVPSVDPAKAPFHSSVSSYSKQVAPIFPFSVALTTSSAQFIPAFPLSFQGRTADRGSWSTPSRWWFRGATRPRSTARRRAAPTPPSRGTSELRRPWAAALAAGVAGRGASGQGGEGGWI